MTVVAVMAPGAMGSAIAARLVEHGAQVRTSLDGRSAATRERAAAVGMTSTDTATLASADLFLSIVPPAEAVTLAQQIAPFLAASTRPATFVDCNAISVDAKRRIAEVIAPTRAIFVDGAIIGLPPRAGETGPRLYLAGAELRAASLLRDLGLDVRVCPGGVGAAAGLKMAYAGLNKGLTALAATMILGATRAGAVDALRDELAETEPGLLARFERGLPDMVPKAYRWVAEMREIAEFLGDDEAGRLIFQGAEMLFARIAAEDGAAAASDLVAFAKGPSAR